MAGDPRKTSRAEHAAGVTSKKDKWKAHPLRERAKKLATEGILTIRFEMPFNVRCSGCDNQIAKGVRFNAEKKTIGKYLSSKILSFRMLCHCEDGTSRTDQRRNPHWIEIHTDPKNAEYIVASGAVRTEARSLLSTEELGVEATLDEDEASKRAADPFYRLEASGPAKRRKPWLSELQDLRDDTWHDDYDANAALRRAHRSTRHAALLTSAHHEAKGIRLALPAEHPADIAAARAAPLRAEHRRSAVARSHQRADLLSGSIFGSTQPGEAERARLMRLQRERGMRITAEERPAARRQLQPVMHPLTTPAAATADSSDGDDGGGDGGGGVTTTAVEASRGVDRYVPLMQPAGTCAVRADERGTGASVDDDDTHGATSSACTGGALVAYSDSSDDEAP